MSRGFIFVIAMLIASAAVAQVWRPGFRPGFQFISPAPPPASSGTTDSTKGTIDTTGMTTDGGTPTTPTVPANALAASNGQGIVTSDGQYIITGN